MASQGLLEVNTPVLSGAAVSDPHVLSLSTNDGRYLHTSPEFPMKRLLAAYASDIYQIAAVFRAEETGRYHNSQFTMLEWYRVGLNHHDLMQDLEVLLKFVWHSFTQPWPGLVTRYYGEEVHQRLLVWPEDASIGMIQAYFHCNGRSFPTAIGNDKNAALDLFMDEFVIADFPSRVFTILQDYPVSQAALARVGQDHNGREVAQRFELYFGSLELANGFNELSDASVQGQRFSHDLDRRKRMQLETQPLDQNLLDALCAGLPDCAGIAVGLERLQMALGGHDHIRQVLSFDDQRA